MGNANYVKFVPIADGEPKFWNWSKNPYQNLSKDAVDLTKYNAQGQKFGSKPNLGPN